MSKIPGLQLKSKLKRPEFKSKAVVPSKVATQNEVAKTASPVIIVPPRHAVDTKEDDEPSSNEQHFENRFSSKAPLQGKQRPRQTKEGQSNLALYKRGPHLPQPRAAVSSGKVPNLHNHSPYSRENETSNRSSPKKRNAFSFSASTASQKDNEKNDMFSGDSSTRKYNIPSRSARPKSHIESTTEKKPIGCPAPGKLSKVGSVSLQNLTSYPRGKGTAPINPELSKINSSKSMQNLSPNCSRERKCPVRAGCNERKKCVSGEGYSLKGSEGRFAGSNLTQPKHYNKDGMVDQQKSLSSAHASNELERSGLRKPTTLRIPVARPPGKPSIHPRANNMKTESSYHKETNCIDNFTSAEEERSSKITTCSNNENSSKGVIGGVSGEHLSLTCGLTNSKFSNEISNGELVSEIAPPLQSTPLRKELGEKHPFKLEGDAKDRKPFTVPLSPMKSVPLETEAQDVDAELAKKTTSIRVPEENKKLIKKDLQRTFDIDDTKNLIEHDEKEYVSDSCGIVTDDPKGGNTTFTKDINAGTAGLYQIVYGLLDEELENPKPLNSTYCRNSENQYPSENRDNDNKCLETSELFLNKETGNISDLCNFEGSELNLTNKDINHCNFNLYDVSPPHSGVSGISMIHDTGDHSALKENISSFSSISIDAHKEVPYNHTDEKEKITDSDLFDQSREVGSIHSRATPGGEKADESFGDGFDIVDFPQVEDSGHDEELVGILNNAASSEPSTANAHALGSSEGQVIATSDSPFEEIEGEEAGVRGNQEESKSVDIPSPSHNEDVTSLHDSVDTSKPDPVLSDIVENNITEKQKCLTLPLARSRSKSQKGFYGHSPLFRPDDITHNGRIFDTLVLKPPNRSLCLLEDDAGNVTLDKWSYIQLQHDIKAMKTALLKLKRNLQEVDVLSPLVRNSSNGPHKFIPHYSSDAEFLPAMRPKAFSDALHGQALATRLRLAQKSTPIEDVQNDAVTSLCSEIHKFDITNGKEKIAEQIKALQKEKEDLEEELKTKNSTIHLLQTQLEGNQYMEERDDLLEQNIILREEVQRLTEELQASRGDVANEIERSRKTCLSTSIKDDFAKQLEGNSRLKAKAGLLQRMYSHDQEHEEADFHE